MVAEPGTSVDEGVFGEECSEALKELTDFANEDGDGSLPTVALLALSLLLRRTVVIVNEPLAKSSWVATTSTLSPFVWRPARVFLPRQALRARVCPDGRPAPPRGPERIPPPPSSLGRHLALFPLW